MNWPLFILFIGACLIYDITAVPTSDVTEPKYEEKSTGNPLNFPKLNLCEQCHGAIFALTFTLPNELQYERLHFYSLAADQLKQSCDLLSDFCALIEGKESEFVKSVMDCTGVKFKESKVQPNCTLPGSKADPGIRENDLLKVCDNYVESCKVYEFTRPTEVPEV